MPDEKKEEANTAIDSVFVDNGDHSWEYYDDSEWVSYDEYMKNGHESYFKS